MHISTLKHNALCRRSLLWLALLSLLTALAGCGGGGGGTGPGATGTNVTGRILRAETNQPEPSATITIGSKNTTSAADGTFSLSNVDSNAKTATVTPKAPAQPRTLTLSLTAHATNSLGDIFVSDTGYTANVTGTVVATINGQQQPVGNATVTIAGSQVKSGTDGKFSIANLPVGLGQDPNASIGAITSPDFETKPIFVQFPLTAGSNDLGTLVLGAPVGKTPPGVPYTITGRVLVSGKPQVGVQVFLIDQATNTTLPGNGSTTDANGVYSFWVVTGSYVADANVNQGEKKSGVINLQSLDAPVTVPDITF